MNSEAWDIQNIKEQQRSAIFQQNFAFVSVHPQNVNRKACKLKTPHCTPISRVQGWTWVEFVWLPVCIFRKFIYIYTSYMSLISPISWQASDYTCHPKIGAHRLYKSQKLSKNSFSFFLPACVQPVWGGKKTTTAAVISTQKSYQGSASPSRSPSLIPLRVEIWDCHPHLLTHQWLDGWNHFHMASGCGNPQKEKEFSKC